MFPSFTWTFPEEEFPEVLKSTEVLKRQYYYGNRFPEACRTSLCTTLKKHEGNYLLRHLQYNK